MTCNRLFARRIVALQFSAVATGLGPRLFRQSILRYGPNILAPASRLHLHTEFRTRRKDIVPTADTIYALSSGPGRAAIAVIRVSGPACLDIYGGLCPNRPFPHPRIATLRKIYEPPSETQIEPRVLDNGALVLYFPAPNTVTGEDVLELHVHGGPAIVKSVLAAIPKCTDTRPRRRTAEFSYIRHAEPGEFTKRAFYNGRIDLTQAEALGDTLAAETEQQQRLALSGADSGLARRYEEWRTMLLYARGELEALIDFSEDQHFDESPVELMGSVSEQVAKLQTQIELHVQNASRGELLRNGISIALLGAPNAGKSSLLNRIVGREAAIVSAEEGTTRDIVDVSVDIGGWLCKLGDMAGLRGASTDPSAPVGLIELEGIRRARERALNSDVVIVLLSLKRSSDGLIELVVSPEVVQAALECEAAGKTIMVVINKSDLIPLDVQQQVKSEILQTACALLPDVPIENYLFLSCLGLRASSAADNDSGGVQAFLQNLTKAFTNMTKARTGEDTGSSVQSTGNSYWAASLSVTHRQSTYLKQCLLHLHDFLVQARPTKLDHNINATHHTDGHEDLVGEIERDVDIVTSAEHLRYAAECLAKITGKGEGGDVEDVLGVVFEK